MASKALRWRWRSPAPRGPGHTACRKAWQFVGNALFERLQAGHRAYWLCLPPSRGHAGETKFWVAGKIRRTLKGLSRYAAELADNGKIVVPIRGSLDRVCTAFSSHPLSLLMDICITIQTTTLCCRDNRIVVAVAMTKCIAKVRYVASFFPLNTIDVHFVTARHLNLPMPQEVCLTQGR